MCTLSLSSYNYLERNGQSWSDRAAGAGASLPLRAGKPKRVGEIDGERRRGCQAAGDESSSIARAIRARVASRPSRAATSNSPGLADRPVRATRSAWMRDAAFTPRASATARSAASADSASNYRQSRERRIDRLQVLAHAVGA